MEGCSGASCLGLPAPMLPASKLPALTFPGLMPVLGDVGEPMADAAVAGRAAVLGEFVDPGAVGGLGVAVLGEVVVVPVLVDGDPVTVDGFGAVAGEFIPVVPVCGLAVVPGCCGFRVSMIGLWMEKESCGSTRALYALFRTRALTSTVRRAR